MNIEDIGELMHLINGDTDDESDDIISETALYDNFCKAVKGLEEFSLDHETIDETINAILEKEEEVSSRSLFVFYVQEQNFQLEPLA